MIKQTHARHQGYKEVFIMRFHVTVMSFEGITGDAEVEALQQLVGQKIQEIQQSGKLISGGSFVEARGGYFVLDIDSATELLKLLTPLHDVTHIETHPVISFESLGTFFQGTL